MVERVSQTLARPISVSSAPRHQDAEEHTQTERDSKGLISYRPSFRSQMITTCCVEMD
jgi:hypothetical protein